MFDDKVPIIEVNKFNYDTLLPLLKDSIKHADMISLDLELSGIGSHKGLAGRPFQDRFDRIRETVQSRSILSIGIATFKLYKCIEDKKTIKLKACAFNILSMSSDNYTVEPDALAFLSKHGFDFNRLINSAILYSIKSRSGPLNALLKDLLTSGASLIFHNGFVDLAFLYHHLFHPIPDSIGSFQSSIHDWFTSEGLDPDLCLGRGLFFDSKFTAASNQHSSTFLEYVFRKSQRSNVLEYRDNRLYVRIKFDQLSEGYGIKPEDVDFIDCAMSPHFLKNDFAIDAESRHSLCPFYAQNGFCRKRDCSLVHEVDLILDLECQKALKKRKRSASVSKKKTRGLPTAVSKKLKDPENEDLEGEDLKAHEKTNFSTKGCHRAGMDAFMTGFIEIYAQRMHLFRHQALDPSLSNQTLIRGLEKPLPIVKSTYAPSTPEHRELWEPLGAKKLKNLKFKSGATSSVV